jgi:AcrR family transcriptional regulator
MRRKSIPRSPRSQSPRKRASATSDFDAAILNAALEEFTQHGYATTRMEDIARRAEVAKGTIYLRFKDKEALFEAIIRQQVSPVVQAIDTALRPGESVREFLARAMLPFLRDLDKSPRGAVMRLLLAEAGRFPKLAELYFQTIVRPGMQSIESLLRRASKRGELSNPALVRYPQLVIAPVIMGVLWSGIFERFQGLNIEAMMRAHLDQLFSGKTRA